MKKFIALVLSIFIVLGLASCAKPSAEEYVKEYMDILCCKDEEQLLEKYVNGEDIDDAVESELGDDISVLGLDGMEDFLLAIFKSLDYEIVSVEEDGENATAKVKFDTIDFKASYENAVKDTISWVKDNPFASTSTITNKIMENYTNEIEKAAQNTKTEEVTVEFDLVYEDGEWEISNGSSAVEEVFSGMLNGMNDINANLESYF